MRGLRPSLGSDSGHRALTQGPLIEAWLMKNDFQPVVGLRFNFRGDPNSHWNGVTDCGVPVVEPIGCSRSFITAMLCAGFAK